MRYRAPGQRPAHLRPTPMLESSERLRSRWRSIDPFMPITTLVILGFGVITIFSADNRQVGFGALAVKQLLYAGLGFGAMVTLAALDYRLLRSLVVPIYLAALTILVLVIPFGMDVLGARRWFDLRFMTFQPSEPAKLAVIVTLAAYVTSCGPRVKNPIYFALSALLVGIPAAFVFKEPDLGTSLVFVAVWCGVMVASRTRTIYLLATLLATIPATYLAWRFLFHDYQKQRLLIFRHPESDIQGQGFNIIQARVTIGQAGLLGHRFADAQTEFQLLAVRTTDFAFAHAIGNFGFIGAVALFILYIILIWRYLRVAELARDEFGRLLAVGATAMLFFQTFVNIGMNAGLLPVTGIPLPFISYGGSPLVTLLAIQGVLQSVLMHREKLTF